MSRILRAALVVAFLVAGSSVTQAQQVTLSGQYGERSGVTVPIPLNPPSVLCSTSDNARCPRGQKNPFIAPPFGPGVAVSQMPQTGVEVDGAGVIIVNGGLNVGDTFTIPPVAFKQLASHKFSPLVDNPSLHQLDTTLTAALPRAQRVDSPPISTRVFSQNNWSNVNGGQNDNNGLNQRASADIVVTATGIGAGGVNIEYIAGPRAFGGTMSSLLDGDGSLYLKGIAVMQPQSPPPTTNWVGTQGLGDGIAGNLNERNGAGWDYTIMNGQVSGIVRDQVGVAGPCFSAFNQSPAGCGLVTEWTVGQGWAGTTVGTVAGANSTKHFHAWTTGTIEAFRSDTVAGFIPFDELITAMGYDTTSMVGGETIRNVGMVAGSWTSRTSVGVTRPGVQMIGIDLKLVPEPGTTAALIGGLGLLGFLARRRS